MRTLWMDFETLGLEGESRVIEIAAMLTNARCEYIGLPFQAVLHTEPEEWDGIDPVVRKMHHDSGLLPESLRSETSETEGWDRLVEWMDRLVERQGDILLRPPLAGSGVHFERKVMETRETGMPERLHYRNIDVSTVRAMLWDADHPAGWVKQPSHRALHDVMDAIAEHKHYLLTLGLFPSEEKA